MQAHVRWHTKAAQKKILQDSIVENHKKIQALYAGKGKPPAVVFEAHRDLGQIGLTYEDLVKHIVPRREETKQNLEEVFKGIAKAVVIGEPLRDSKNKENERLWLTVENHQVSIDPFYELNSPILKDKYGGVPCWIVSGYEQIPARREEVKEVKEKGDRAVKIERTTLN